MNKLSINKEAYMKLIDEDLAYLNQFCPDTPERDHIKVIICKSIDWLYPDEQADTKQSKR